MIFSEDEYELKHYGTPRHSGRYPWGSGKTPQERQRSQTDFLHLTEKLRSEGLSDIEIAQSLGITTSVLRNARSIAKNAKKQSDISLAQRLKNKGMSNTAIAAQMGINESSVRALLKPGELDKLKVLDVTSDVLRKAVAENKYIDVGAGVELHMGISNDKLKKAVAVLESEGYEIHRIKVDQLGTGHQTTLKVLVGPDTDFRELIQNKDKIVPPTDVSDDGGRTYSKIQTPIQVDSSRIAVRYAEDGGKDADGVIYVRPGVKDLSLGSARYAQVRIAVDGTHYLKGMAMYKDDLPDGTDLVFNTNKSDTGNKLDAMKEQKTDKDGNIDPDNPFGSIVNQIKEKDAFGRDIPNTVSSAMNIVNEEGDWEDWSKSLSSQFLSKQSTALAKEQLGKMLESKQDDLDEIRNLDNPVVKKKMLQSFADDADSAAVHLKAAALPRQRTQVILPIESMKPTEIYAPNFNNGERVVLVRYPHSGTFEIPELTVNNRQPEARKLLGQAEDAVGIHSSVAEQLSGADFDGDTVLVIPNNDRKVKTKPTLDGLKDFDPKSLYPDYPGMHRMTSSEKAFEMGDVSNLITDMTIMGAPDVELARAARHSMVVIDAEKHNLNYKQSAIDNTIGALKEKYQGKANGGASTIVSRASSRLDVPERKQGYKVDPDTGKKIFTETGKKYEVTTSNKRTGEEKTEVITKSQRSTKLAETDDAHTLTSGPRDTPGMPIEEIYADHSNDLKDLANQARKEMIETKTRAYSPPAKEAYRDQVESLNAKLREALRNSPRERQAQIVANAVVSAKKSANPDIDKAELKKIKFVELENARARVGASKKYVDITPDEWAAIQAGAISTKKLTDILDNADLDKVKQLATPKEKHELSDSQRNLIETYVRGDYTPAEIAAALGVPLSTVKRAINTSRKKSAGDDYDDE